MGRWGSKKGASAPAGGALEVARGPAALKEQAVQEEDKAALANGALEVHSSPASLRQEGVAKEEASSEPGVRLAIASSDQAAPDAAAASAAACLGGRSPSPGKAWFPVMSQEELAAISMPASAPRERLRSVLAQHGACLLTGLLSPEECRRLESLWCQDLCSLLDGEVDAWLPEELMVLEGLKRDGPRAWPSSWSSCLGTKGCSSQRATPHGSFAWTARLHPAVRSAFADVYETTAAELAVGLDVVFWSAADSPGAESNLEWLHCDQNHQTGMTWPCVQGVLYVWPSEGERASTTVIWPGSHREAYDRIMQDEAACSRGRSRGGQSVRLSSLEDASLREALTAAAVTEARRVPCPAGSLLLWDSRTIHQGWAGGPRLAQPVCWEPRGRREEDPGALRRKVFMCAAGVPSSHSAAEGRVHGMAPRRPPAAACGGTLREQLAPWALAEGQLGQWTELQRELWAWGGDPRRNANRADAASLSRLLRREVLEAL